MRPAKIVNADVPTAEEWRSIKAGDSVEVVEPIGNTELKLLGKVLDVVRIDLTRGYAVCAEGARRWHLHPEALKIVSRGNGS